MENNKRNDEKTQVSGTNDYSIQSKYSLVRKGYINDPYLVNFVANQYVSRSPIINWGYYVRYYSIEFALERIKCFSNLSSAINKNVIVSFGAGFDTLSLRNRQLPFIELDYPSVCIRKARLILQNNYFVEDVTSENPLSIVDDKKYCFYPNRQFGIIFMTSSFVLIGVDLRNIQQLKTILQNSSNHLSSMITDFKFISNTKYDDFYRFVFLNECALCYIQTDDGNSALETVKIFLSSCFENKTKFVYLAYEMYENSHLSNGYTEFMKSHFREIGAEILNFPTKEHIRDRCKILDLKNCEIYTAREIKDRFGFKDKKFQDNFCLEPFDEWEDLDSVTMSYSLTIAHNEDCFQSKEYSDSLIIYDKTDEDYIKREYSQSFELSVFDHSSIMLDNSVFLFGGFGIEPQESFRVVEGQSLKSKVGHRRFQNVIKLQIDDSWNRITNVNVIKTQKNSGNSINRQHCKVELLSSNENSMKFLLSGGRTSPKTIQNNAIVEIFCDNNRNSPDSGDKLPIQEFVLHTDSGFSKNSIPSFRHVFSSMSIDNEYDHKLFIQYGGFEDISIVPSDNQNRIWFYNAERDEWQISDMIHSSNFTNRHSAAFVPYSGCKGILSHGGLLKNSSEFYKNFDLIDSRDNRIHHLNIPDLESRYGHQILPDTESDTRFWIFGGIAQDSIRNNAVLVDMKTLKTIRNIEFFNHNQKTFLLQKFTVHQSSINNNDNNRWITIGGGGNCFSFGTFFNTVNFL